MEGKRREGAEREGSYIDDKDVRNTIAGEME